MQRVTGLPFHFLAFLSRCTLQRSVFTMQNAPLDLRICNPVVLQPFHGETRHVQLRHTVCADLRRATSAL